MEEPQLDISTWTNVELRQTFQALYALAWMGRLTQEDVILLAAVIAERIQRGSNHPDPH